MIMEKDKFQIEGTGNSCYCKQYYGFSKLPGSLNS